jgi:hypothetical protein
MKHKGYLFVAVFAALLGAAPVWAHHSIWAEFYQDKVWTKTGVLTKIDWINPHTVTWVSVKNPETGKMEDVGCQGGNPARYSRSGFKVSDWKIGEVVTITCNQAKNGSTTWGFINTMQYQSTGQVMELGRGFQRNYR